MAAITIIDTHGLCTPSQLNVLLNCSSLNFNLGEYNSLSHILNSLDVKVYIRQGSKKNNNTPFLESALDYWKSRLKMKNDEISEETILNRIQRIIGELNDSSHYLRGLYNPSENIIELFPDVMKKEYNGGKMDELLISTLAHETMHAYFNRPGHDCYPYAYFVEEPLAEFGMLLYMDVCMNGMFTWAYNDVAGKSSCYRYGATLYDQRGNLALRKYLEDYKCDINQYEILDVDCRTSRVVLPSPVVSHSPITAPTIPSGTIVFDHSTGVISPSDQRIFIMIPKALISSIGVDKGKRIQLSYYDKSGISLFTGQVSVIRANTLNFLKDIKKDFIKKYGSTGKKDFRYFVLGKYEWIAKEL